MSEQLLLLGDQAIALAAVDSGITGVYAYPGTPSTEITEFIQEHPAAKGICSRWCTNEKTAMEAALGVSYCGKRALVAMKHVGLNVAADAFINAAMTGTNGGLVVVAADDPSMHSSQNEQDSRFYGKFALVPTLEPSSQQEAYDMTREAFELSERFRVPVLLRITTRMAHSRAVVHPSDPVPAHTEITYPKTPSDWVLLPGNARRRYDELVNWQSRFEQLAQERNTFTKGSKQGVVACGIAYNYLMENFPEGINMSVLKVTQYPLPRVTLQVMAFHCEEIVVLEEGQPFVEEQLRGIMPGSCKIRGRLTGDLPRTGELNPNLVCRALDMERVELPPCSDIVVPRPPSLCAGCGHRDLYTVLNRIVAEYESAVVFGDIGCYTLGFLPPYGVLRTCVDMGASITMAKGAADAGQFPSIAVIGDSTFTHSGITGLLDAVNSGSNITVIISDNLTTAMTGGQESAGTGRIEQICAGVGVEAEHIRTVVPVAGNMDEIAEIIRQEIAHGGVSVIIPRRECIQTLKRKLKKRRQ